MRAAASVLVVTLGLVASKAGAQDLPPLPRGRDIPKPLPAPLERPRAEPRPAAPRPGAFTEEARVDRVVIDAHVTYDDGEPIRDLVASDFIVRVDGRRVPLESAEWVPASSNEFAASLKPGDITWGDVPPTTEPVLAYPPGLIIVLLYQTNYDPIRIQGFLRMAQYTGRFLETLLPTDRVAVVSFDSHLKLRQDFTDDPQKIRNAMIACLRTEEPGRIEPGPPD